MSTPKCQSAVTRSRRSGLSRHHFCEDNSDFYCMAETGEVVFWSHDGATAERWPDLATWISEVWIGGN